MPEIYVKQVAEDGSESFVQLTEVPEDVVKTHPEYDRVNKLYSKAVEESKDRLRRAQAAEAKLNETNPKEEKEPKQEDPKKVETPLFDREALKAELLKEIKDDFAAQAQATSNEEAEIQNLLRKHRLTGIEGAADALRNAKDRNALAESLGRAAKQFAPMMGGDVDVATGDFMEGVRSNLGLPVKK
jgi:uncharacterized protein with von Willebrand factor type A (vWA) domain